MEQNEIIMVLKSLQTRPDLGQSKFQEVGGKGLQ